MTQAEDESRTYVFVVIDENRYKLSRIPYHVCTQYSLEFLMRLRKLKTEAVWLFCFTENEFHQQKQQRGQTSVTVANVRYCSVSFDERNRSKSEFGRAQRFGRS